VVTNCAVVDLTPVQLLDCGRITLHRTFGSDERVNTMLIDIYPIS
jgi:hypothetical protein